jgi:hypothetical protein
MTTVPLHLEPVPIDLGTGWKATDVWVTGGPIFLVQATSESGQVQKSRLDTHKSMFIDPLPITADEKRIQDLVDVVISATGKLGR